MTKFVVCLDLSALEKYKSESEPFNVVVDTEKLETVGEFISWFQTLFSIHEPVDLFDGKTCVKVTKNIRALIPRIKLIVKPSTSVGNSNKELPIIKKECEDIAVPLVAKNNDVKYIPAPAPAKDEKTCKCSPQKDEKNKQKIKTESNREKPKNNRIIYICQYMYEDGKLKENIKDINIENSSSHHNLESDDLLLYRCYSKSKENLRNHIASHSAPHIQSCILNDIKLDYKNCTGKLLGMPQNIYNKPNERNGEPQSPAPQANDAIPKDKPKKQKKKKINNSTCLCVCDLEREKF